MLKWAVRFNMYLASYTALKMIFIFIIVIVVIAKCAIMKSQHNLEKGILEKLLKIKFDIKMFGQGKECAICIVSLKQDDLIISLPCDPRHYFHVDCINEWLKTNSVCPICRTSINMEALQKAKAKTIQDVEKFIKEKNNDNEKP